MTETRPLVLIGTYTRGDNGSKGVYIARQDTDTGALEIVGHGPELTSPSYLAVHPTKRYLYAVDNLTDNEGNVYGAITAMTLDPDTGAMEIINSSSTVGRGPCHVNIDGEGKVVTAANYGGGSVAAFSVAEDGSLSEATYFQQFEGRSCHDPRQTAPHAHSTWPDPSDQYLFACDLGTDKVMIFKYDKAEGKLVAGHQSYARIKGGCGPRHLTFHPNGKWMYVLNEVASSITVFDWCAESGTLTEVQHIATIPADYDGPRNTAADIHITPDGSLLYATNRGQDAIIMCRIDQATGELTFLGYEPCGDHPRNCAIDPDGRWFYTAHMNGDDIYCYEIDYATGLLKRTENVLDIPAPVCMKWV